MLGEGVEIGPYAVVGDGRRRSARGPPSAPTPRSQGPAVFGEDNRIFAHAALGFEPQDLKYRGERDAARRWARATSSASSRPSHRGTASGHGETVIGDDNYFMNYTHVAHDNRIGSRVVMANSAVLAGHVEVGNHAIIGAFNAIHQFCRVGAYAFLGAYTGCRQDVLPFCRTDGLDARDLRTEHDRPEAQRLLRRADRGASEGLPVPGQVEAQHEPGARADRGGARRAARRRGAGALHQDERAGLHQVNGAEPVRPRRRRRRPPRAPPRPRGARGCRGSRSWASTTTTRAAPRRSPASPACGSCRGPRRSPTPPRRSSSRHRRAPTASSGGSSSSADSTS